MAQRFKEVISAFGLKKLCYILWLCGGINGYSQVFYSVNPKYLKSKTESNNLVSDFRYSYPDTSIIEQASYFPRNFMGNLGLASPDYIWHYGTEDVGFRFVLPPLTIDKIKENDVTYYRTTGPYASLNGIGGSKQLQIFKLLFTHTYKDKVNITIGFKRYTSLGFYKQQQSYTNNFYLSSNYTSSKKRSGYYLYILNNGNKNRENGGIRDSALTDSSMVIDKALFDVRLSNANRDNRETKAMVNPWIRLNKNDSAGADHYIQLKSKFATNSYRYTDFSIYSDGFYSKIYLDTVKTVDSSRVRKFSNEIAWSVLSRNNRLGASIGYVNEINQVWQKIDSVFLNHIVRADLVYRKPFVMKDTLVKTKQSFETRLNVQYIVAGPNSGNYKAESNSIFNFNEEKKRSVFLDFLFENRSADYIYNNWVSNHFLWFNNGYKPQSQFQTRLGVSLGNPFSASVFYQAIGNYLYFDHEALPRQFSGTVANLGLNLNFTKIFFKHIGIGLNHIYQNASHKAYVRVPGNITTAKLFYNGSLAKNNLLLQIGAQAQLYETFSPYAYMPSTQVFYLQDQFKTSSYPYLDVYLSARIRPVSFFLKVENVLQAYAGPNYAFVPGYYQTDLAFRFGLTWMFFD